MKNARHPNAPELMPGGANVGSDDMEIVAEISKTWSPDTHDMEPISSKFETVIQFNNARGFKLVSWQLSQIQLYPMSLTETIIAVFKRCDITAEKK